MRSLRPSSGSRRRESGNRQRRTSISPRSHVRSIRREHLTQFTPYLNFNGDCEAAFRFYQRVLGGKLEMKTHGDSPIAGQVPEHWHSRILHARLEVGDAVLMASDSPPEMYQRPQGLYVSIGVNEVADAERIFQALAEGGSVTMPMERTFWAERFGMLVDRFGVPWMINCDTSRSPSTAGMSANELAEAR